MDTRINDDNRYNPELAHLNLNHMDLRDIDIPSIMDYLDKHPEIISLSVIGNWFSTKFCSAIIKNQTIIYLNIHYACDRDALILSKSKFLVSVNAQHGWLSPQAREILTNKLIYNRSIPFLWKELLICSEFHKGFHDKNSALQSLDKNVACLIYKFMFAQVLNHPLENLNGLKTTWHNKKDQEAKATEQLILLKSLLDESEFWEQRGQSLAINKFKEVLKLTYPSPTTAWLAIRHLAQVQPRKFNFFKFSIDNDLYNLCMIISFGANVPANLKTLHDKIQAAKLGNKKNNSLQF